MKNKVLFVVIIGVFIALFFVFYNKSDSDEHELSLPHNKEAYSKIEILSSDKKNDGSNYLNYSGIKKVESSLVLDSYGLYLSSNISIDDVNNPYLIAFNIKKYLSEGLSEDDYSSMEKYIPSDYINTLKWDKCFSNRCNNLDNYKVIYRVSKDELNRYMHKTYNTTNNYNLLANNEEETSDIIRPFTVIDSSDKYYTIFINNGLYDPPVHTIKTKIIDSKEDDDFLYISNKFIVCDSDPQGSSCEKQLIGLDAEDKNVIVQCLNDEDSYKCDIDVALESYYSKLDTYKHTFKKVNGNYYWVKTELVN